jgi:hypothetical protein
MLKLFDEEVAQRFVLSKEYDFQDYDFLFFDEPICYYDLSNITTKISSFSQLQYYAEVFLYLNPEIDFQMLFGMFQVRGNREWGYSIRTFSKARVKQMCEEVYYDKVIPFCNKKRKVLFNPARIISTEEKLSICGVLFKRHLSITEEDIMSAVYEINASNMPINDNRISSILNCSQRTIQRRITPAIRNVINKSNRDIKRKIKVNKIIEYIDVLSEGGNDVKIRELKKFISVKDYSMIKEAFSKYKESL